MRGRKPIPTNLKVLSGYRNDRINTDEPQPGEGVPTCPSRTPRVREVWDYTMTQLLAMRTVSMADRDALHAYCQAVVLFEQATEMLEKDGLVNYTKEGRAMPHPAQKIQLSASNSIRSYCSEFGLTPSARTRVKVADQKPKEQGASRLLSG